MQFQDAREQGELFRSLRQWWAGLSPVRRDFYILLPVTLAIVFSIEYTQMCDRIFAWIVANPELEIDAVILGIVQLSLGLCIIAWRRLREVSTALAQRDAAETEFQKLALHDPLTGLANRRALGEHLQQACVPGSNFGLIMLDLDQFKVVNDLHGHAAGDRLLRQVAERIDFAHDHSAKAYRLGGDEFAIVVPAGPDGFLGMEQLARQLLHELSQPYADANLVHHLGASAGLALYPEDADDPGSLLRAADVALYRAKESGRGQLRSFELEMDAAIRRRATLEQEIRAALAASEFVPYYQPIVDLRTLEIDGFELLARWERPDGKVVNPDEFIPIAEECGLINDILFSMLDHALVNARGWNSALTVAINISPVQLKDPWLADKILGKLTRHGFPAHRLAIELTESAIIADEANACRMIETFKNQGMCIGLDDFGTGYSSLHHLRALPFDKIKIDRSFVHDLEGDGERMKIIRAIVGLAASLDLTVIAEGIETASAVAFLRELGCAQGQGFLFSQALTGAEISCMLQNGTALSALEPPARLRA